ncbi:MAG: 3-deoxy-manno-octulosonate cytidylyltransferase [Candidatus Caenarcaniphilales bacterium]|nr:3-deoxy-manno-octulosonate cytidylyltransferase [Candidatus Caenarcaniphilales bacterium]
MKKSVAVIPSRYESSRLPGKPLLKLGEKTMIELVYEQVSKAKHLDEVIVATDNEEIYEHVKSFGGKVAMTSKEHKSGTDRIAELAKQNNDWEIIVNVQGDEPFIDPKDIDKSLEPFLHDPHLEMLSIYHHFDDFSEINNPNNVKVVTDINDFALYFSRSAIPCARDGIAENYRYKKHLGLYVYRKDTLLNISALAESKLEKIEKLEQLRALENQIKIKMIEVQSKSIGIDTQADYEKALRLIEQVNH